ncbi:hypothetical protein [Ornithinibacillus halophilus]|uniref:DoxX-like family protein n=1 Tax=Ornithinibacillus halophilus TaxID=930117 RepID=A0A1M5JCE7_9BACI|nr:hypothetical protein [Ornithinibacillus halophilus]SHG38276.1 hypothetical protein SAMN05216225_102935 [Ornithinibacillus halophilus]
MSIDSGRLVPFFLMWGIPIFMVIRTYIKMDVNDRKSAKRDFRRPRFVFTIGLIVIGTLISQIGSILLLEIVNLVGIIILSIGGIVSVVGMWRENRIKSVFVFLIITIAIYFLYV